LDAVRTLVRSRLSRLRGLRADSLGALLGGKMLRARLALRLAGATLTPRKVVLAVSAVVEMVHAASLLHDDVIDGAELRRGRRAFWRLTSTEVSILTGDLLLADAACLLAEMDDPTILPLFCQKVREMCEAEAFHELFLRGRSLSEEQCLNIARGKTGPLFAFAAGACAGGDGELATALEESGYRLGSAYQLADDLLDFSQDEEVAGKTLGTDFQRGKFTLAALYQCTTSGGTSAKTPTELVWSRVSELLASVSALLEPWPEVTAAVPGFIEADLLGVMEKCLGTELGFGDGLRRHVEATDLERPAVSVQYEGVP